MDQDFIDLHSDLYFMGEALRQAHADGHTLVIVTGRRWEGLDLVVKVTRKMRK